MKPDHPLNDIRTCIFVEYEDGTKGLVKPGIGETDMFMHVDGSVVRVKRDDSDKPKIKHLVPMQYTGMKDVNNVEIYEHDIVECLEQGKKLTGIIEWFDYGFHFVVDGNAFNLKDIKQVKKIGNFYYGTTEDIKQNIDIAQVVEA